MRTGGTAILRAMLKTARTCVAVLALSAASVTLVAQERVTFPAAPPEQQGLSSEALELLSAEIERLVSEDALVGGELHVIQGRRTVLHRAFGSADREQEDALEVDSLFCVRSMTKPLVGTAIQILIDEGRLQLDTRASEILPAWDTPETSAITIEHLLTHTTGLPFSTITQPLSEYENLGAVAAEAATTKRLFEPGAGFQYSDGGSDTLGAIVAALSGGPVEDFIQQRILDPLGMSDSETLLAHADASSIERIPSAYSGSRDAWQRHWKHDDPPIFPMFLTSQSLYSTTADYARFVALWMDGGRDLLSPAAMERGLTARNRLPSPTGFDGLQPFYAQQWIVYASDVDARPVLFGHSGSDGTHAWAWPERDLIVMFFTQTRGTLAGIELEGALQRLLIEGDIEGFIAQRDARAAAAAADHSAYEGLYWDETNRRAYYVVRNTGTQLVIERPGAFTTALLPQATTGHFALEADPERILEFEAPVDGESPAFLFPFGERVERQARHRPNSNLPSTDEVMTDLLVAHGLDTGSDIGVVRMTGTVAIRTRAMHGTVEALFDARRLAFKVDFGSIVERVWITEDDRVITQTMQADPVELSGAAREQMLNDHPVRRVSDWRDAYASVDVLRPVVSDAEAVLLVRTVPHEGAGSTRLVDYDTGLFVGADCLEVIPMVGTVGYRSSFGDFRDVAGMQVPFAVRIDYQNQLLGVVEFKYDAVETDVEPGDAFEPPGQ